MSLTSSLIRFMFGRNDRKHNRGFKTPADLTEWCDLPYGPEAEQVLDVYKPVAFQGQKVPLIISTHGGGWVYGSKKGYKPYCASLAQRGFAVINFSYRLAPESKFPKQLEDVCTVAKWALDHAEQFGFDLQAVFMVGDSAGAHLTSLFVSLLTDPGLAAHFGFRAPPGFFPLGLGLHCGVYHLSVPEKPKGKWEKMQAGLMKDFLGKDYRQAIVFADASRYINASFPPCCLISARGDQALKEAQWLDSRLTELKVTHVLKVYGDEKNPLYHVFFLNLDEKEGQRAIDEEAAWMKSLIKE